MAQIHNTLRIDWSETSTRRFNLSAALALVGIAAIVVTFLYHHFRLGPGEQLLGYEIGRLDWLWLASVWLTTTHLLLPAVRNWESVRTIVGQFRSRPVALVSGVFAIGVFVVGTVGPLFIEQPTPHFVYSHQPPVFTSVPRDWLTGCKNLVGSRCYGSWAHPLGTTASGKDILRMLIIGARTTTKMSMVAVMLIVPVSATVGTVSAYLGGRVDRFLSGLAETVKTIPAILVFLTWRWVSGDGTVFMLVVSFGLVSWGSIAGIVRSRALNEVSKNYIKSAQASGASTYEVIRWHLLPNIGRTAFSTAIYQIPLFITYEAALSFLQIGTPPSPLMLTPTSHEAWGEMIGNNLGAFDPWWWTTLMPVLTLLCTMFSVYIFASAFQDVIDPRANEE